MTQNNRQPALIDWIDGLIAAVTALVCLGLYARTLVPGLLPGDGGEFQTLAYTLGHAHTTGYEVYTVLAHVFIQVLPVGEVAFRVNLFSAFCAAVTVGLVYLTGRVLTRSRWAGLVGAVALAVSATFWSQAVIAEVYTAGSAFTAAILCMVLLWHETHRSRFLVAAGILGGLALAVHGSNSLFAPAIALLILLSGKYLKRAWLPALAGAGLGLLLMGAAFIVVDANPTPTSIIRSVYQPSISRWDMESEQLDTLTGRFTFLFFAQQWRSAMFSDDPETVPNNLANFSKAIAQDFALPVRILILAGLIALLIRRRQLGLFFCAALLVHILYTLNYRIFDIYVFYISLYVYLGTLAAEGAAWAAAVIPGLIKPLGRLPGWVPPAAYSIAALLLIGLAIQPVYAQRKAAVEQGEIRFDFMYLKSNRELQGWRAVIADNVRHLPANAVVLTDWDKLYAYYYAAQVEQGRGDLMFLETYPYAQKNGLADSLVAFIKQQIKNGRPVLTDRELEELSRSGLSSNRVAVGTERMFKVEE